MLLEAGHHVILPLHGGQVEELHPDLRVEESLLRGAPRHQDPVLVEGAGVLTATLLQGGQVHPHT